MMVKALGERGHGRCESTTENELRLEELAGTTLQHKRLTLRNVRGQ
jgi:hypothetical protein